MPCNKFLITLHGITIINIYSFTPYYNYSIFARYRPPSFLPQPTCSKVKIDPGNVLVNNKSIFYLLVICFAVTTRERVAVNPSIGDAGQSHSINCFETIYASLRRKPAFLFFSGVSQVDAQGY